MDCVYFACPYLQTQLMGRDEAFRSPLTHKTVRVQCCVHHESQGEIMLFVAVVSLISFEVLLRVEEEAYEEVEEEAPKDETEIQKLPRNLDDLGSFPSTITQVDDMISFEIERELVKSSLYNFSGG
ncbi:hypothetical protein CR513_27450, partial [Mucuna pruriens]